MDQSLLIAYVSAVAQVFGILVGAGMVVFSVNRNAEASLKSARQKIYQSLELASIDLFRFECKYPNLVAELNSKKRSEREGPHSIRHELKAYICQLLNLFEMAYRFRRDDIFAPDIFGSWVIWMWELCCQPLFKFGWEDGIKWNYIPEFRKLMSAGIAIADEEGTPADKRDKFFKLVANAMNDEDYVAKWFDETPLGTIYGPMDR